MSDLESGALPQAVLTAGGLLKQARMAKGLHIAALATSIKVTPRKLELLESDRFDELPGATFTRALAQTVCRTLKIDATPVLALLPQATGQGLSQMSLGLNAPFRDRPGRRVPSDLQFLKSPVVLGAAVLLAASAVVYLLPKGWLSDFTQRPAANNESVASDNAPAPDAASAPIPLAESASAPVAVAATAEQVASAPASASAVAASQPTPMPTSALPAVSGALQLRASAESWVEVIDGRGAPLLSRMLQPGEAVGLDGASPLRVRIGNAAATQVSFKGQAVALTPRRDNVAKLELR